MPRARKTASGAPAQRIESVPGRRYGEGVAQQAMQRQMPAPNLIDDPAADKRRRDAQVALSQMGGHRAEDEGRTADPHGRGRGAAPASPQDLMAIAAAMRGRAGLLQGPSARPNEPVTAGLASGPGPGPEALNMRRGSPTADVLNRLADETGDSFLRDLIARSRP